MKGNKAKTFIINKILETFNGAFLNGKEIRIPFNEDGAEVQIKVALTCAKENIEHDTIITQSTIAPSNNDITEEEKNDVESLLQRLGL